MLIRHAVLADPPTIVGIKTDVYYLEAANSAVALFNESVLLDDDDVDMTQLLVSISQTGSATVGACDASTDILFVDPEFLTTAIGVVTSFDATTCTLSITGTSGSIPITQMEDAMRSTMYGNLNAHNPSMFAFSQANLTRLIHVTAIDANASGTTTYHNASAAMPTFLDIVAKDGKFHCMFYDTSLSDNIRVWICVLVCRPCAF
jgi:hypothetical protein